MGLCESQYGDRQFNYIITVWSIDENGEKIFFNSETKNYKSEEEIYEDIYVPSEGEYLVQVEAKSLSCYIDPYVRNCYRKCSYLYYFYNKVYGDSYTKFLDSNNYERTLGVCC
jgi:hypothetical protein